MAKNDGCVGGPAESDALCRSMLKSRSHVVAFWTATFASLPACERRAILLALLNAETNERAE